MFIFYHKLLNNNTSSNFLNFKPTISKANERCLDITRFYEEQRQLSSGSARPACLNKVNRSPLLGAEGLHRFAPQFVTAVTASPLVDCVSSYHHKSRHNLPSHHTITFDPTFLSIHHNHLSKHHIYPPILPSHINLSLYPPMIYPFPKLSLHYIFFLLI